MALAVTNPSLGTPLNADTGSTTGQMTTNVAVAAGDYAYAFVYGHQAITSVTDNSGNGYTWVLDKVINNGASLTIAVYRTYASAGLASGTVITVTWAASSNVRMICGCSVGGELAASPLDQQDSSISFGSGTAWGSSSITPTATPSIVFGLMGGNGDANQSSTPDAGWTELFDLKSTTPDHFTVVYQIVTGLSARNPSGV